MERKKIIIIRIFLWLILAVILGCLAYLKIAPTGKISYTYDFSKPQFFIGKLTPAERVTISSGSAKITGEPVYFSLRTPRRFEKASVTVKFKNNSDSPIVELGLLNDKVTWSNDIKPLQNKIIDRLMMVWPTVSRDGLNLIERDKKYQTVDEFLERLPEAREIALYHYNLKNNFILDQYKPQNEFRTIETSFRGPGQFYTYIENEELDYAFNFVDLNVNKDNDPIDVKVYSPDGLIYSNHLADDTAAGPERQANFRIPDLPAGVYRLSIIANDDIITKNITSRQSRFAIINKVWLSSGQRKNLVLYSNSRLISAQTINPASLGIIKVGQETIDLNETYKQFSLKVASQPAAKPKASGPNGSESGIVKVELAKDDIIISGDGVFSFTEADMIDPRHKNVDRNLDINQEKINYILTDYKRPLKAGEWLIATADFDLTKAYQENGKYQFLVSVPGFKVEGAASGVMEIKEIKINLTGTSLWQKINKYFSQ